MIGEKTVNLVGEKQTAIVANDALPAPTLHWRSGGQVEMGKDLSEHGGLLDDSNDFHIATPVTAVFDGDIKHPLNG